MSWSVSMQVLSDPPRALLQRIDVRRVALFAGDLLEILRDEHEELAEARVLRGKLEEKLAGLGGGDRLGRVASRLPVRVPMEMSVG
jgi:hypothetical protein